TPNTETVGAVVSIFTVVADEALTFPARSRHAPETLAPEVSEPTVVGAVQLTTPLCTVPTSPFDENVTTTFALFHPLAFAGGAALTVGGLGAVRSMLIPLTLADELLPAWSVQLPLALWFAPSALMLTGAVLEATPEPPSLQAKVTITGWFVHPPETNGEPFTVAIAFRIGGFLSTLISPMGPATVQFWERSHT